ncbi:MAG: hypothetical protein V1859_01990 [archaeon]
MESQKVLWKDCGLSFINTFIITSTMFLLVLTPLIPLAFWRFNVVKYYITGFYTINLTLFLFLLMQLLNERNRWLYFNQNGIVIKWAPETGKHYEMFGWHNIKRINILSSWNPKSYMRWKRIKKDLSYTLFFASALYSNMLILETTKDQIYFVGVNDYENFLKILNGAKTQNTYLNNVPIMNYGVKW